jgi:hypothetical protein
MWDRNNWYHIVKEASAAGQDLRNIKDKTPTLEAWKKILRIVPSEFESLDEK